jgi:phage tail-like protein
MTDTPSAPLDRRDVFKLSLLAAAAGLVPASATAEKLVPPQSTARVVVDIPGLPEASRGTFAVEIDPLEIDVEAHGRQRDGTFRVFHPGDVHFGHATFTSACTLGGSKELQTWFNDVVAGKNIRKNITVTLFKSDKSPGRSYTLMDCFPTQWSAVNFDTSSSVQTETIRVKCGRIEFKV